MTTQMKRVFFIILGLFIAILSGPSAHTSEVKPASDGLRYKLSAMVPETGNIAFIGQPIHNALILANEQMRERLKEANIEIELIFADTQGNPREAVTQFGRMADVEKVNGIITTLSGVIGAISPLAKRISLYVVGFSNTLIFNEK